MICYLLVGDMSGLSSKDFSSGSVGSVVQIFTGIKTKNIYTFLYIAIYLYIF